MPACATNQRGHGINSYHLLVFEDFYTLSQHLQHCCRDSFDLLLNVGLHNNFDVLGQINKSSLHLIQILKMVSLLTLLLLLEYFPFGCMDTVAFAVCAMNSATNSIHVVSTTVCRLPFTFYIGAHA